MGHLEFTIGFECWLLEVGSLADAHTVALVASQLGDIAAAQQDFPEARESYRTAVRIQQLHNDTSAIVESAWHLGKTEFELGNLDEASAHIRLVISLNLDRPPTEIEACERIDAYALLAVLELRAGKLLDAEDAAQQGLEIAIDASRTFGDVSAHSPRCACAGYSRICRFSAGTLRGRSTWAHKLKRTRQSYSVPAIRLCRTLKTGWPKCGNGTDSRLPDRKPELRRGRNRYDSTALRATQTRWAEDAHRCQGPHVCANSALSWSRDDAQITRPSA